jgi:hypothetical protein
MGVPHVLQNLSPGFATVPHCGHALMISFGLPRADFELWRAGGAYELARKSASGVSS